MPDRAAASSKALLKKRGAVILASLQVIDSMREIKSKLPALSKCRELVNKGCYALQMLPDQLR